MPNNSRLGYGFGNPLPALHPVPIISTRAPTAGDLNFELGTTWISTTTNQAWTMTGSAAGVATWSLSSPGASDVDTLTGDAGGAISPVAGNINILGGATTNVTGAGSTLTVAPSAAGYPTTPYVVGPVGTGGYATIQAAINAANAAGGNATVFVRNGTYTEDLTLFSTINVVGATGLGDLGDCVIIGEHTPPAAGRFVFRNFLLQDANNIFNSAVAGTADLVIIDCLVNCTNGYTFNLVNWTGTFTCFDMGETSTNNGFVNNTGGASLFMTNVTCGAGVGNTMVVTGNSEFYNVHVQCPITIQGTSTTTINGGCWFDNILTTAATATVSIANSLFTTGANAAIAHGSANALTLSQVTINSANATPIGGAGAGALDLGNVDFIQNSVIAGTVTQTYARATDRTTPYVVGPTGNFATVQEALDAATTTGVAEVVYVQGGTYTEDLTLYTLVDIKGSGLLSTIIVGVHTPPAAGQVVFQDIRLNSPTDIFNSAAAGTTDIMLVNTFIDVTNGHIFDLLNWTGSLFVDNSGTGGTTDGVLNNTGGATLRLTDCTVGAGAGILTLDDGVFECVSSNVICPLALGGTTTIDVNQGSAFNNTLTTGGTSNGTIVNSSFATAANAAITHGSAGTLDLDSVVINSANAPSIAGAGAGNLTIGNCTFTNNAALAGTLTVVYDQTTTGVLNATGAHLINSGAGNDITLTMGDNAGANAVIFNDLAGNPVLTIDSNGILAPLAGLTVTGAFAQTAGTFDVGQDNAANAIAIGGGNVARVIGIGNSAAAHTMTVGSLNGAASLDLQCGTGNFTLEGNVATTYAISNVGVNTGQVDIAGGTGARTINIGGGGTGSKTINIGAAASADFITIGDATGGGSLDLACGTGDMTLTSTGVADILIDSDNQLLLDSDGVLELNSSAGIIGIGNDADAFAINVGTGAAARVITVGNVTGATQVVLNSGTGGITATGGAAGVIADFVTRTGDDIAFTQSPLTCTAANTGGVATGATGDLNLLTFQEGIIMEQFILGAGQTIIKPVMTATGLLISGDETNTEGFEYNFGAARANSRHSFTIGTSPAFFLLWRFRADDISGLEPCYCGFRRTQANQATGNIALYTDFVAYGPNDGIAPGDAAISTQLNTGGLVNTDTNDAWADTATHELGIYVSAAGVVTFTFDGGAPTATQAYTFDNGDVVHPFFRHEFNAALPDAIEWIDFQCGFQ